MACTSYFLNDVLVKRPYLSEALCRRIVANPIRREVQPDGRIRFWGFDETLGEWVRVVTLADADTIHNAFPDRGFSP